MSSAASRIVIIGAGIGGLTLALLLRRRGVIAEIIHRDGRDGTRIAAHALGRQYREAFGAPMFGLHRIALQQLIEQLPRLPDPGARQVQAASWATSAVLHLPGGPAAQVRDAYLASLPERLAWIHGYDILARSSGKSSERRQNPARSQGGSR